MGESAEVKGREKKVSSKEKGESKRRGLSTARLLLCMLEHLSIPSESEHLTR